MKKHSLKILDQLACDAQFSDTEPVTYIYGTCSCGERLQGGRTEDELRAHHAEHVAASK